MVVALTLTSGVFEATAAAQQRKPWEHAPGPIAGTWNVSCADSAGMQISFKLVDTKNAVGVIAKLGAAKQFGYRKGETIFKLEAQDSGAWQGKLLWRSVSRVRRWDPIYLVASGDTLSAQMSTDACYRNMTRVQ
ncbi:MAG: hypothetical protein KC503_31665 [Myxococcales bacterium]|nr:hypothetical protein [Myxococcales bacterium]